MSSASEEMISQKVLMVVTESGVTLGVAAVERGIARRLGFRVREGDPVLLDSADDDTLRDPWVCEVDGEVGDCMAGSGAIIGRRRQHCLQAGMAQRIVRQKCRVCLRLDDWATGACAWRCIGYCKKRDCVGTLLEKCRE